MYGVEVYQYYNVINLFTKFEVVRALNFTDLMTFDMLLMQHKQIVFC